MRKDSPYYKSCFEVLARSPLFSTLDAVVLEEMLGIFQHQTLVRGEMAISPQQASDRFYLIIRGRAKVSVCNPDNGREHTLFLIGPGDGFDLISLLDGERHDAVATALDDMEVLSTSIQQARVWIEQHVEFNRAFLPYLGKQMRVLANQVIDLSLYDTEARLSRLILRNLIVDKLPHEIQLINDLSQEAIATMIGTVRVVIARHLQNWKQEKVISGKRGHWSILDLEALLEKAKQ